MVKILSNGDIVPDDDPRAQSSSSRGTGAKSARPRQVWNFFFFSVGTGVGHINECKYSSTWQDSLKPF